MTAGGVLVLLGIVTMAIVSGLVYAAVPAVLQEAVLGRPVTFAAVWRQAWARRARRDRCPDPHRPGRDRARCSSRALITAMVSAITMASGGGPPIAISVGVIGALITGPLAVWLWVKFCLAPAAVVFEGQGPCRRAAPLVPAGRGDWWRIFGITLLAGLDGRGGRLRRPDAVLGPRRVPRHDRLRVSWRTTRAHGGRGRDERLSGRDRAGRAGRARSSRRRSRSW